MPCKGALASPPHATAVPGDTESLFKSRISLVAAGTATTALESDGPNGSGFGPYWTTSVTAAWGATPAVAGSMEGGSRHFAGMKLGDTPRGWRLITPALRAHYGVDTMPEAAEHEAAYTSSSAAPTRTTLRWPANRRQWRVAGRHVDPRDRSGQRRPEKGQADHLRADDHLRATSLEMLEKLKQVVSADGA